MEQDTDGAGRTGEGRCRVRVFYDDMGSIGFVNLSFARKLEKKELPAGYSIRCFRDLICS